MGGIVSLSAKSAATPQELTKAVRGRLDALARAHRLRMHTHGLTTRSDEDDEEDEDEEDASLADGNSGDASGHFCRSANDSSVMSP